ncbi:uncharacterized protein [Dysidea avara]|uniref:uncharacterized protein n=1 Tax=Dysidea avara TaxID=196820 RepID=UPI003324AF3F
MSDFYPECYHVVYGAQRPVRWSALETLQGGLCTLPSNVWSFGITLWEIVTLAEFPYSDVTNRNVLAHVMLGSRLDQPHDCPNEMYELMCNCWNTSPRQRPIFADITNQLRNLARLYSSDDDIGIPTSDSAFFIKQHQWRQDTQSPPQSFHYNDQNMSHLLIAQMSASDAVSITFSALGSTEDLTQTGISASTIDDNRHRNVMSPMVIPTETDSSIHSPEESLPPTPLSPTPHINIVPATVSYGLDQHPMVPSRVPLRNEPVNRFLLKADGSRESTPDCRLSMLSDSQYSSSQFSTDMSESSRQHLLRHKGDSPDKRPARAAIAEQIHGDEQLSRKTSNPVPVIEGDMFSELMASFDEQMNHSSNQ